MKKVSFEELIGGLVGDPRYRLPEILHMLQVLKARPDTPLLDLAAGLGESAALMNAMGFRVDGNEVEPRNLAVAEPKFAVYGRRIFSNDWRHMRDPLSLIEKGELPPYEGLFCEGNSFPSYLPLEERADALRNFVRLLERGGRLSVDFRNYETWPVAIPIPLENNWHYFGDVRATGLRYPDGSVTLSYHRADRWSELHLFHVSLDELLSLYETNGLRVAGIYVNGERREEPRPQEESPSSFLQVVGEKVKDV